MCMILTHSHTTLDFLDGSILKFKMPATWLTGFSLLIYIVLAYSYCECLPFIVNFFLKQVDISLSKNWILRQLNYCCVYY